MRYPIFIVFQKLVRKSSRLLTTSLLFHIANFPPITINFSLYNLQLHNMLLIEN